MIQKRIVKLHQKEQMIKKVFVRKVYHEVKSLWKHDISLFHNVYQKK